MCQAANLCVSSSMVSNVGESVQQLTGEKHNIYSKPIYHPLSHGDVVLTPNTMRLIGRTGPAEPDKKCFLSGRGGPERPRDLCGDRTAVERVYGGETGVCLSVCARSRQTH